MVTYSRFHKLFKYAVLNLLICAPFHETSAQFALLQGGQPKTKHPASPPPVIASQNTSIAAQNKIKSMAMVGPASSFTSPTASAPVTNTVDFWYRRPLLRLSENGDVDNNGQEYQVDLIGIGMGGYTRQELDVVLGSIPDPAPDQTPSKERKLAAERKICNFYGTNIKKFRSEDVHGEGPQYNSYDTDKKTTTLNTLGTNCHHACKWQYIEFLSGFDYGKFGGQYGNPSTPSNPQPINAIPGKWSGYLEYIVDIYKDQLVTSDLFCVCVPPNTDSNFDFTQDTNSELPGQSTLIDFYRSGNDENKKFVEVVSQNHLQFSVMEYWQYPKSRLIINCNP